ncbi:30S ribosome-binding factor RbfA [Blochmannia endosymbiont of Camponotus (Colobopsis) obliquus]|uniref:30S ribosome-binding factor RbfA n=1 Tax=Blochmannia endosymbiont of Camponotus (Colobopsis) obliquus TaxID=1505597 RepID=UPI00061A82C7|nr:30S ribosome-binding factor RbfA [Blochmannia endosymbiont of Camponotus (Colobopsis) obliquus]AKC60282.1 ribosome-binding factor A [Blochmannia endosymbiont of Camponotus (Colobopsis) obliquus]
MGANNYHRIRRFAHEIKKHIAVILQRDVNDYRVGVVTVSGVDVSRDLVYAKVFVTFLDKSKDIDIKHGICVLQIASGFIRHALSKVMCLRIVPNLIFVYDTSLVEGIRMSNLITQVTRRDIELQNKNHG